VAIFDLFLGSPFGFSWVHVGCHGEKGPIVGFGEHRVGLGGL